MRNHAYSDFANIIFCYHVLCAEPFFLQDMASFSSEGFYTNDDKGEDMPPCGKWGLELQCIGAGCKACEMAVNDDAKALSLASFFKTPEKPEKKGEPLGHATLKTPSCRKPLFLERATVDTPEKALQDHRKESGCWNLKNTQ